MYNILEETMSNLTDLYQQWMAMQPLSDADANRLHRKFMLDFNYNSNHIEGNTLTYEQTEVLLLLGEVIGNAKMSDLEEMKAHNVCLKMMQTEADTDNPLTETFIRQLHHTMLREDYIVYRNLPNGTQTSYVVHAGRYKTRPNSVITPTGERFEYASPEETPALMYDLVKWYNDEEKNNELSAIEIASLFHYRYIRIHPFEDGNGRIARLMVNFILLRHKYPMIVIHSKNKNAYLHALGSADSKVGPVPSAGAHASLAQIKDFVKYMEGQLVREITGNIAFLKGTPGQIWWYDGDLVSFRSPKTPQLLTILKEQPRVTITDLSTLLGINRSAVQKQLKTLSNKGYIIREGTPQQWHVIIISTTK